MRKELAHLAQRSESQHGVFTRPQALASGFSPDQVDGRLASGLWVSIHRGVFRWAGTQLSLEGRVLAAVLACGRESYASHETAGVLWKLEDISSGKLHVVVAGRRRVRIPGVVVHRPENLSKRDATTLGAIPVTTPTRTIIDLASKLTADRLEDVLDDAIRRGLVSAAALERKTRDFNSQGRRGMAELQWLLSERIGRRPSGSGWENKVRRLLKRAGYPDPVRQYTVTRPDGSFVARVDLAIPEAKLAIEYDSWEWHGGSREAFVSDRRRWNRLRDAGWPPLLVTDRSLTETPDEIVAYVGRALGRADVGSLRRPEDGEVTRAERRDQRLGKQTAAMTGK